RRSREGLLGYSVLVLINRAHSQPEAVQTACLSGKRRIKEERGAVGGGEADTDGAGLQHDVFKYARAWCELGLPYVGRPVDGDAGDRHLQYLPKSWRIVWSAADRIQNLQLANGLVVEARNQDHGFIGKLQTLDMRQPINAFGADEVRDNDHIIAEIQRRAAIV